MTGLVKTLALEAPELFCRTLDLTPELSDDEVGTAFAEEIADTALNVYEVARTRTGRRTPDLVGEPTRLVDTPAETPDAPLGEDDLLLVTGGARGITAWCVTALARRAPCGYLLLGRSPLAAEPDWAAGLEGDDALTAALTDRLRAAGEDPGQPSTGARVAREVREISAARDIRTTLAALHAAGVEADYIAADLADAQSVRTAVSPHAHRVTGVVHAAGVLADQFLADKRPEDVQRVVSVKLTGLGHVLDVLDPDRLRRLVVFTSVSGIYGNMRQADYAMANEALSRFACAWKARHGACRVTALAWGPWAGGMANAGVQKLFMEYGVPLLTRETGAGYFTEQMITPRGAGLVTVIGPLEPFYQRRDQFPAGGAVVERRLASLATERLLAEHSIHGWPVLPMTGAVGWCVHTLEGLHGGQQVRECRDFQIKKGLVFDGSEADRFVLTARAAGDEPRLLSVAVHSEKEEAAEPTLRFTGVFLLGDEPPRASPLDLPGCPLPEFDPQTHEAYRDFLFHGPLLRGLGPVVDEEPGRLVLLARMADLAFAKGAFSGAEYSAALSDLLLQAAALLGRQRFGALCLPVAVARIEFFGPLPTGTPFLLIAEAVKESPLHLVCTVTACTVDGQPLQRWNDITMLLTSRELAEGGFFVPAKRGAQHG